MHVVNVVRMIRGKSIPLLPQKGKPSDASRNYNSLDIRTDHRPRRHAAWNCVIFCIAENLLNLNVLRSQYVINKILLNVNNLHL